jgi:hypothetical protein
MKFSLCSEKFETFEIWAMFTLEGPHIVMSRTDAQNGLDFHFKVQPLSYNISGGSARHERVSPKT